MSSSWGVGGSRNGPSGWYHQWLLATLLCNFMKALLAAGCCCFCWLLLLAAAMKVLNARAGRVDYIADCCAALQKSVLYFVWYSYMTHSTNHGLTWGWLGGDHSPYHTWWWYSSQPSSHVFSKLALSLEWWDYLVPFALVKTEST